MIDQLFCTNVWGVNCSNLFRATIIQHQSSKVGHGNMGSVALPAVLRAGGDGQQFTTGSMQKAQFSHMQSQAFSGHAPPYPVSSIPTHAFMYSLHFEGKGSKL